MARAAQMFAPFCLSIFTAKFVLDFSSGFGRERGLKIIEDAAQAWGAEWNGAKAGGLGDIAAFSFYPTKNLSAAGDAGMVTTNSAELAERVKMLRQHGMRRRYHHDELGWNARMDGFQGAVLNVKLKYIGAWNEARRALAARYQALFAKAGLAEAGPYPVHGVVLPREVPGAKHVWHQYVIRAPRRDALREFLTARGIGSEIYYPVPLHLQDALKSLGYKKAIFLKPSAPRAKCWRCLSSRNFARTSSKPWSRQSRSFSARRAPNLRLKSCATISTTLRRSKSASSSGAERFCCFPRSTGR